MLMLILNNYKRTFYYGEKNYSEDDGDSISFTVDDTVEKTSITVNAIDYYGSSDDVAIDINI